MDLILVELFHIIVTTNLHYNMHTFTISTLILNTPDFEIHSNTKFMVISYNQNLHFKIQKNVKNSRNKITIHFIIF
jgi:hypothetical protein